MSLRDVLAVFRPRFERRLRGMTKREAEKRLRAGGMSRRAAKAFIAEHGGRLGLARPE